MKILMDHDGMASLIFAWETSDYTRYFVADAPARAIVAFQNGLDASALGGAVVEMQSGEEIGQAGRVRLNNVGLPHSLITITQRVDGPPDSTLSNVLATGRQDEVS